MKQLDEHFFRHEYGRLVALLARTVGLRQLELAEEAAQAALAAAAERWPAAGLPDSPPAWLFRVAANHLAGERRRRARQARLAAQHELESGGAVVAAPGAYLAADVRDALLRMLFACCDEAIPVESQLVLALKTLCGFGVREIAERLFTSEANVYKRLGRARERLRALPIELGELTPAQLAARLPAVRSILYLLFTEGYLSSHAEGPLRRELCHEALRLTTELAAHPAGAAPDTYALLALMHLHAARLPARQDGSGGLLLLEEQDRALWNQSEIQLGLSWLARSAEGAAFSRYHAEAGVAAEHCLAPSFAETRWERIVACYELLERLQPSALHTLNRALALAEQQGPAAGLALLAGRAPPTWLAGSYLWSAALADLHRRCGHAQLAEQHRAAAIEAAPSAVVRAALERRLGAAERR